MKQRILPIAIVLMLAAAALFMPAGCAACGESDLSGHALVGGTWTSTQEGSWGQYVFRPDGTGNRGLGVQSETFTWSIPGAGRITINRDNARAGELRREQWNYSITDGVLNLESRQTDFNFTFNRVGGTETATTAPPAAGNEENDNEFALTAQEREFVGSWAWAEAPEWNYNFYDDGTGSRGTQEENEAFEWAAEEGVLLIITDAIEEMWSYTIAEGLLTITSMQAEGIAYSYVRVA